MIGANISGDDTDDLRGDSTCGQDLTVPAFAVTSGPGGESPRERYLGPYRLLEHIGGGGMGVVYRAEDTRLQRIVALKLLPPELTRDPIAKARFFQEARTASALDHPNICSIYEIGETADLQLYLVMPCYDGETLRERIDRGALPIGEALDIASQVAQGLAKAHRSGIIHRDIKPGNLMITADGLMKILDFGIAKLAGRAGLTRTGSVVGTPAYMSPEQMNGDDVDVRTDLWSLGIVLYEMVTGQRPFRGGHESVLREAILHAAPEPLTQRRPDAPAELQRLVSGLLAKDPTARTAPAEEVARTLRRLAGEETSPRPVWAWPAAGAPRKWLLPAAALLLLATLAGLFAVARRERSPAAAIHPPSPGVGEVVPAGANRPDRRLSLLVVGFQDLSGDTSARGWLGPALTEMLTTELAAGAMVRVVPGEHAELVRRSLALYPAKSPDRIPLDRLYSMAGTDLAVIGAYLPLKGQGERSLRLDVRVLAMPEGHTVASVAEVGSEAKLFDLVSRTGERLRRAFGLSLLTAEQALEARHLLPADSGAIRLYTEALMHLRASEPGAARDLLLEAEKLEPESAAIQSALIETWTLLGHDQKARESAAKAFRLRGSLSREARLAIEAQLYKAEQKWGRASEIYRTLWTFFPDDIEYGLKLAFTLVMDARGHEAMSVLEEVRKLPAPEGEDPRIDVLEARVARRISDFVTQERAAAAAAAKARRIGARLIEAQALLYRGDALRSSGEAQEALDFFRQAETIALQVKDRWILGMLYSNTGSALQELGRPREASQMHQRSLAIARELGTDVGVSAQLFTLGKLHSEQGDLEQARPLLEQAREGHLRIGDSMMLARVELSMASLFLTQGELDRAETLLAHALETSRLAGSRIDEAQILHEQAKLRDLLGDLQDARRLQEEALQILRGVEQPTVAASVLGASADLLARTGGFQLAQRRFDQALAVGRKADNALASEKLLELRTRSTSSAGNLATSRAASEARIGIARKIGSRPLEANALRDLARIAEAAGELASAQDLLRESLRLSTEMRDHLKTAAARVDLAQIELERGESDSAERLARETAEWYRARRISGGEAAATTILADSLLALGRRDEARIAAERVRKLLPEDDRELFVSVAPALARVETAAGAPGALQRLREAISEAEEAGFVLAALEARLTLGQLLLGRGDAAGRTTLQVVQKEATARGLGSIARRAAEAISPPPSPSAPPPPPPRAASPAARAGI